MAYTADRVVEIAEAQVGYLEKRSNKDLDSKTANAGGGNYTKYGRDMHNLEPSVMDYPAYWCDAFVDWCHWQAADKDAALAKKGLCGGFNDYTVESASLYKNAGRWGYTPHKGDQVFFKGTGGINHTGIVQRVTDTSIYTIEGNKGNAVKECHYARGDSRIAGYGYPNYTGESGKPGPAPSVQVLEVDGKVGPATVKAWQRVMGTTVDGVIGGQSSASKSCHSAINAIRYASDKHGSALVRAVQRKLGCDTDGLLGPKTIKAVQSHLGVTADGHFGPNTAKALQRQLNKGRF